jgi:hypothetical protein
MEHQIKHRTFHHIINSHVSSKHSGSSQLIVEEKIDGSNFYFATDGSNVVCGIRHTDETKFFNWQTNLHLKQRMIPLYHQLGIKDATMYLYGELIPTQKRIRYLPNGQSAFIVYDLLVVPFNQENEDNDTNFWLPKKQWAPVATEHGFIVNPTLFEGTLEQCLQFDVENTKSIIPSLLDKNTTIVSPMEGVVIKYGNMALKKKAIAFQEMEAGKGVRIDLIKEKHRTNKLVNPDVIATNELIGSMLTISRLENIISQIGDNMEPNPLRLSNAVVLDAIEESKDDENGVIHRLSKSKIKKIQQEYAIIYMDQVKEYMKW